MKIKFYKKALTLSLSIALTVSPFLCACQNSTVTLTATPSQSPSTAIVDIIETVKPVEIIEVDNTSTIVPTTPSPTPIIEEPIPVEDILEEPTRNIRDIEELKEKKVIMLTFDDGPSPKTTLSFLDELLKRDAKVTFFVVGYVAEKYPDIIKRAYDEGHTVASHTYNHPELTKISDQSILDELNKTNQLLTDILGIENRYTRPPYGSTNKHVFDLSNQSFILWNVDPRDWQYRNADTVYQNIMNGISDGAIVVLHDIHATTIEGSLKAIDDLLADGYAIISLEEAEQLGYINMEKNEKVYSLSK